MNTSPTLMFHSLEVVVSVSLITEVTVLQAELVSMYMC